MAVLIVKHGWSPVPGDRRGDRALGAADRARSTGSWSRASASRRSSSRWPACWPGRAAAQRARRDGHGQPHRQLDHRPDGHVLLRRRGLGRRGGRRSRAYVGVDLLGRRRRRRKRGPAGAGRSASLVFRIGARRARRSIAVGRRAQPGPRRCRSCVLILFGFVVARSSYITERTRFGRHIFAVGGNAEAARRAGIKIDRRPHRRLHARLDAGGGRRHPGRVAPAGGEPVLGRQRPAADGDRRPGHRRHEPLRRPRHRCGRRCSARSSSARSPTAWTCSRSRRR